MKNLKTIILFIFAFSIGLISAQNFNDFSSSLKKGDVNEISDFLDDKVEVSILSNDSYTRSEAEGLLASFFTGSSNNQYKAIHKGSTLNDSFYQIGELKMNSDTYRTYIYSKKSGEDYRIQEFRIEK